MRNCALATYTLRVTENGEPNVALPLDNFGNRWDLLQVLTAYLTARETQSYRDVREQHILRVTHCFGSDRTVSGLFEKGEYGTEEPLVNVETLAQDYIIRPDQAPMYPHYFLANLPALVDVGLLVLERSGQKGIKTDFADDFTPYFAAKCDGFQVRIDPLMPDHLLRYYVDHGEVSEIRLLRFHLPNDFFDAYGLNGLQEQIGAVLTLRGAGLNPFRNRIRDFIGQQHDVTEFIEVRHISYDSVSIEFTMNGKSRVISLDRPLAKGATWDITENHSLEFGENGHPIFESVDGIARDYVNDIFGQMGLRR